jgi:hypothetical protein
MPDEPRLDIDLPPALTTLHLSGQGLVQADLQVDQDLILLVKGTVRKAGMAHDADGPPHPFATVQAETVRLIGDGASLLTGLAGIQVGVTIDETTGPEAAADAVIAAVRDDRRRRAREERK